MRYSGRGPRRTAVLGATVVVVAAVASVALAAPVAVARIPDTYPAGPTAAPVAALPPVAVGGREPAAAKPLAGIRIALDPGHQLGNHNFPSRITRQVQAGGFTKPCNSTGTATNSGYPEATFTFQLTRTVAARLRALGATVFLTRTRNSQSLWGPCVDTRGRFGAKVGAALAVSLHGDGSRANARGFHVIAPIARRPWTTDIAADSWRLAQALRAGLDARGVPRSNYLAGGTALVRRSDLGTLNLSDVPIAMIEIGNMRNATDARLMKSASGRSTYATAVIRGIRRYLHR